MLWVILFACAPPMLGMYVAYANHWKWGYDRSDFWLLLAAGVVITAMLTLAAGAAGFGVSSIVGDYLVTGKYRQYWTNEPIWKGQMVSMRSSDGVQGSVAGGIFMISGRIDSSQVYYYYTRNQNGSFKPQKWHPDSDTAIYEEDRKDGEVLQFATEFRPEWLEWIGTKQNRLRMDFHVPKGSIHQEFDLK